MTTPARVYDYDMATRAARAPQGGRGAVRPRSGRLRDAARCSRRPTTANWCRCRSSTARTRRSTAVGAAASSTATAPTASPSPPRSRTNRLSLVDRGFVYAIAHIRGGKDKGYPLVRRRTAREEGQHLHRLRRRGAVSRRRSATPRAGKIVGWGGSAGGLLIGAVANMAPELFAGLIAEVPFVDVLDTMLDDTLPLTPPEWPEWGNPIVSEADFRTILAYSPYDNVAAQRLPGDPRAGRAHRPARDLLGAGEVGGEAARAHHRRPADPACAPTWTPATAAPPAASTGCRSPPSPPRSR